MTVTKTASSATFFGNGSATVFPLQFYVSPTDTLRLFRIAEGGTLSPVLSGFSFVGNKTTETTALTFSTAPELGAEYYAVRETEQSQRVSLKGQVSYNPEVVEGVWDKLTRLAQELSAGAGKVLRATTNLRPINLVADSVLSVDSSGENVVCGPSVRDIIDAAARAEVAVDAAARAEVAASILGVEACTFHPRDYIPAAQMAHILNGNTALQDETIVTAGLRAMHDAAMAYVKSGGTTVSRIATCHYSGSFAVNGELFSDQFAEDLWTLPQTQNKFAFVGLGLAIFQLKNWAAGIASIRRTGAYGVSAPLGEAGSGATTPIVVVLSGQSNPMADPDATDGTFRVTPLVKLFNAQTGQFSTADLQNVSYSVSQDVDAGSYGTIGGGKNNLGVAFCHRLAEETGRQVYLIVNGKSGQSISQWIGSGAASVLFKALNQDVTAALAAIGRTKVDYFLWQQGEADAADTNYAAKVQTLLAQLGGRSWWGANTYFLAGEPCRNNLNPNLPNLLTEVRKIETDGNDKTKLVSSFGLPYIAEGTQQHFSGAGLWALGYGHYYQALASDPSKVGIPDPVPTALFRWEQPSARATGPILRSIRFVGADTNEDPIAIKASRLNKHSWSNVEVRDFRNTAKHLEGVVNGREIDCTFEGCGWQPTRALGNGFISATARFSVSGADITATEPVFLPGHTGAVFHVSGAGPSGAAYGGAITYVDSTHATFESAAPTAVSGKTGSFGVLICSGTAGSATLAVPFMPAEFNFVGRYVTVVGGDGGASGAANLTARVLVQTASALTLSANLNSDVSGVPLIVAPQEFVAQTTDFGANGGAVNVKANDYRVIGQRSENPRYDGTGSAVTGYYSGATVVDYIASKWHGQSDLYNNFASNFAALILDDCPAFNAPYARIEWGGYSRTYGSIMVMGETAGVRLPDATIGNSRTSAGSSTFYLAPLDGAVENWSVGVSGNDFSSARNLVTYGPNGSAANLMALGAFEADGYPAGYNPGEPTHRAHSAAINKLGIGGDPSETGALSVHAQDTYTPVEFWLGDDRYLWRVNETGLALGKSIDGDTATFPVLVEWGASASSIIASADYLQLRKPRLTGVPSYANNAAALAGGLVAGETYQVSGTNPRQLAIVY